MHQGENGLTDVFRVSIEDDGVLTLLDSDGGAAFKAISAVTSDCLLQIS